MGIGGATAERSARDGWTAYATAVFGLIRLIRMVLPAMRAWCQRPIAPRNSAQHSASAPLAASITPGIITKPWQTPA